MSGNEGQGKVEKPHPNFEHPHEVVADPALSKQEKAEALATLEQDARQLAVASAEGMSGGEPAHLAEVLDAKKSLELEPTDYAYKAVLHDLRLRHAAGALDSKQPLIQRAIEALEALEHATFSASGFPGNPAPDSEAEIAEEADKEKLDP